MDVIITNTHEHPEYIDALKKMDDSYRIFYGARQIANESANGMEHYTSGVDESLFNDFLEKKAEVESIANEIRSKK